MPSIAVLHPGAMGVALAAALRDIGHDVCWVRAERHRATRACAEAERLPALDALEGIARVDYVVSVCPPHAAQAQAHAVVAAGFRGCYVDANAVSPDTARAMAAAVEAAGAGYVDGGIIGPPPVQPGVARLYLSGPDAEAVAACFRDSRLEPHVVAGGPGAASALKMCYAAYTKGSTALLLAIRALAASEGVDATLLGEWARSQPGLSERSERSAADTAPKAWRFVGEMSEIAATFEQAALPGGFHQAAGEIYRRLAPLRELDEATLEAVVHALLTD